MLCSESEHSVTMIVHFSVLVTSSLFSETACDTCTFHTRFHSVCSNMDEKYHHLSLTVPRGSVCSLHAWREMGLTEVSPSQHVYKRLVW